MKLKCFFVVFTVFISSTLIGQSLDEYKYVIVPAKFDFQKTEDQYQLNSLTKFLFEKEGFITQFDNLEMSSDISKNPCAVLTAKVENVSNMFTTKMVIELINCKNQKVLIGEEGRSKEKDYKKGYQEALRRAFESVTAQNYSYNGTNSSEITMDNTSEKANTVVEKAQEVIEEEVIEVEEIEEVEIEETMIESASTSTIINNFKDLDQKGNLLGMPMAKKLYAQENRMGYNLVDSEPKIIFQLLKSGKENIYYIKDRSGTFFKEEGKWYAEFYYGGHLIKGEYDVKW